MASRAGMPATAMETRLRPPWGISAVFSSSQVTAPPMTANLPSKLPKTWPSSHEGGGLSEDDAVRLPVGPLAFKECFADVAHMAEAGVGVCGQVGDEPMPVWLP